MGPFKDCIDIATELGGITTLEAAQQLFEKKMELHMYCTIRDKPSGRQYQWIIKGLYVVCLMFMHLYIVFNIIETRNSPKTTTNWKKQDLPLSDFGMDAWDLFQYKDGILTYGTGVGDSMLKDRQPIGRLSFNKGFGQTSKMASL